MTGRTGIITGLLREADALGCDPGTPANSNHPLCAVSAADVHIAETACRELVARGAHVLISAGLAGGLSPASKPGDIYIADRVIDPGGTEWIPDSELTEQLRRVAAALDTNTGTLAGVDRMLARPEDKAALFNTTGAEAADMESHISARVAHEAGIPFAAIRVVADDFRQKLPSFVAESVTPDGATQLGPILAGLAKNPLEIPALIRLGSGYRQAMRALRRVGPCIEALVIR